MKRYLGFLLLALSVGLLLSACKLSITSFVAPDTTETGTVITLNLSCYAEDIGDNATKHGVVLQIPENWQIISAKAQANSHVGTLNEQPDYELLYTAEPGYKVWVGTSSQTGSGDKTVTMTIKVLTGDFDGNLGDARTYTLKAAVGVYRNDAWVTDDPEGEFDFSNITEEKYVESIIVTKVEDNEPPDPVSTLKAEDLLTGSDIRLDWSDYDEDAQGDVVSYRIYQSTSSFDDVSGMTPIDTVPAGTFTYQVSGLTEGMEYFFAVTAVDEVPNENKGVTAVSIVPQKGGSIKGRVTDEDGSPISNIYIYAYDYSTGDWSWAAYSQSDGSYCITSLPTGTYRVFADARNTDYVSEYYDNRLHEDADPVSVTKGQETTGIDFQLVLGGKISGTVRDSEGNPIKDLWIRAFDNACGGNWLGEDYTDENGNYTISGLPAGDCYVQTCASCDGLNYVDEWWDNTTDCNQAVPVPVSLNSTREDIDFTMWPIAALSFGAKTGTPDSTVSIPITLDNNSAIVGCQFDVVFNSDVLEGGGSAEPSAALKATGFNATSSVVEPGRIRVVIAPPVQTPLPIIPNGEVVDLPIHIKPDAQEGTETLNFENIVGSDGSNNSVSIGTVPGKITITYIQPGDANGDKQINVQDVIGIINDILGTGTASGSPDCNDDGSINIQDVICVINKILGVEGGRLKID